MLRVTGRILVRRAGVQEIKQTLDIPKVTTAIQPQPMFYDPYPDFVPRNEFILEQNPHWMLGHMNQAKVKIPKVMKTVDVIVEVRDARAPLTTAQFELSQFAKEYEHKQRLVVLNKADLVTPKVALKAKELIESQGLACITTSAVSEHKIVKIKEFIVENIEVKYKSIGLWSMLIGLPNMGKSSIINALKKTAENEAFYTKHNDDTIKGISRNEARTNKNPGTTEKIDRFMICGKPKIFMFDTPGVTFLKDRLDPERNLRLAALGILPDHLTGEMYIADYILWRLNRARKFDYVDVLELDGPTDSSQFLVTKLATVLSRNKRQSDVDLLAGARMFIRLFREAKLGKICLDDIPNTDQVTAAVSLEFETEPPGPWGPSCYPKQTWMRALV